MYIGYYYTSLYLINIHWLSVDFDWSRAGHAEGAILSCRMTILPSDAISTYKRAAALVFTCVCFTVHVEGDILSCHMIILLFDVKSAQKCSCTCSHMRLSSGMSLKVVRYNKTIVALE